MKTRTHIHEEAFPVAPEQMFALLHTPSAVRAWWGAARLVVLPEPGGFWGAAWGDDEDDPEYVTVATIREFDPPRRMLLTDYRYRTKSGGLPFEADFQTEFLVTPQGLGSVLRVSQAGFPQGSQADAFYTACETGWRDTFAGIRRHLDTRVPENHS